MPAELETPAATAVPPASPAAPPAEPALNLDTAFSDAAAAQRTTPPEPPAPQSSAPETPVPTATAPAAPTTPAAPSINPSLLSRAQAANLPLDGIQTDADLARALFDHLQGVIPYAQFGQQQLALPPAAPAAAPQDQPQEWTLDEYFAEQWKVPEWKPEYQLAIDKGMVTADAQGNIVPAPGFEAMVLPLISGMNSALAARQEQQAKLFTEGNPLQNIYRALEEPLVRKFQELLEQRFSGYQQSQQQTTLVEKFEADNSAWLYSAPGQLTQQGQQFTAAVASLRQSGVKDPQKLIDWGLKIAGVNPQAASAPPAAAAPAQPAAPAAAAGERQRDPANGQFLKADGQPSISPPAAPPAPSKQESFLESARNRARHSPSRQGHDSSPDDPVRLEQGDLDNFFTQAYRQAAGAN